jgi:hypothetical protein
MGKTGAKKQVKNSSTFKVNQFQLEKRERRGITWFFFI